MNWKANNKLTTKYIALIAVFSSLYAILRYVPLGPMIGLQGSFSFSDALAPLMGIILGPFVGGASVIIGTFTTAALGKPLVFFGLDFLPGFVNCIAMGLLIKRKWTSVAALYTLLLGFIIFSPYSLALVQVNSLAIPFAWLHIVAFIILLSPLRSKAVNNIKKFNISKMSLSLTTLALIGTMLQHLTGNLLTQLFLGVFSEEATDFTILWTAVFYAYPFERSLIVLITVVIGVPLIIVIKKSMLPFETPINEQK